jgi:hypothetical protein
MAQAQTVNKLTRQSVVICTYGPSGIGKTTDQGYSFPCALFVAAPGALASLQSVCGFTPATTFVKTMQEATKLIQDVSKDFNAIVIDDFSFLAEQTLSFLEKKHKGFQLWGALRDSAIEFRDTARFAGIDVILNAWEQPPKTGVTGKIRGGPLLSGKLPEQIPALCDIVLRAAHEPSRKPWPSAYRCNNDPSYITKDRYNIAPVVDPAPMNLSELLRAAGIAVDRHPNYPDQEETVEAVAQELVQEAAKGTMYNKANEFYKMLSTSGVPNTYARWTLRDALDRATIRMALTRASDTFIDLSVL